MRALRIEWPLRAGAERDQRGWLLRFWWKWNEVAYIVLGLRGPCLMVEFPSDWSERRQGWIRVGIGIARFAVAFPWPWLSKDDGQCSGHTFGFSFFGDSLHLHWGKQHGKQDDPFAVIGMPWRWRHLLTEELTEPESHPYRYVLASGDVQHRNAMINARRRVWTRWWLPHRMERRSIDVEFDEEVGERTGSWKGGTLGCGYDMQPGEQPIDTLRRMERERRFT